MACLLFRAIPVSTEPITLCFQVVIFLNYTFFQLFHDKDINIIMDIILRTVIQTTIKTHAVSSLPFSIYKTSFITCCEAHYPISLYIFHLLFWAYRTFLISGAHFWMGTVLDIHPEVRKFELWVGEPYFLWHKVPFKMVVNKQTQQNSQTYCIYMLIGH